MRRRRVTPLTRRSATEPPQLGHLQRDEREGPNGEKDEEARHGSVDGAEPCWCGTRPRQHFELLADWMPPCTRLVWTGKVNVGTPVSPLSCGLTETCSHDSYETGANL